MNCPDCGWPRVSEHRTRTAIHRRCQFIGCNWSETVPLQGQKQAHRPLKGGDTGRLRAVLKWAKDLGW